MSEKKITIKEVKDKIIKDKDGNEWKISIDKKEVNFPKDAKKGETESTDKIKVKYEETKKDGKKGETDVNVIYNSGWFFTDAQLPKTIGTDIEMKENQSLSVKGYEWGFYITGFVLVVALIGFVWWWVSSSRKEDKEEEGL